MVTIHAPRFWTFRAPCLAITLVALTISMTSRGYAQTRIQSSDLGLEISLPGDSKPLTRLPTGGATLISRNRLKVNDPNEAGEFTAIDVHAERYADGMKVTLIVIYNDLSNQEWWKDKKEKLVGSYLIRAGETVLASELNKLGIEPFEMKTRAAEVVVLKPGEGPRIINNTTALEVARLERHLDYYLISLKNISSKDVVAYTISTGRTGQSASNGGRGIPVIAAGAATRESPLDGPSVERDGITISNVIFDDGTFEGDPNTAAQFLARAEGVRIQAPHVLLKIDQTLAVDDSELLAAFDKTEAELWVIPEAIDKQSALEFLKSKFPSLDEKKWSDLYEELKGGLYDGRNIALSEMGVNRRIVRERQQRNEDDATAAKSLRATLEHVKQTLERIVSGKL